MQFFGYGIEPLVFGYVKQGEPIATFNPGKAILSEFIQEKADLMVTADSEWLKNMASPSNDPVEYIKQVIDLMK